LVGRREQELHLLTRRQPLDQVRARAVLLRIPASELADQVRVPDLAHECGEREVGVTTPAADLARQGLVIDARDPPVAEASRHLRDA
jgi:hypothetical protein